MQFYLPSLLSIATEASSWINKTLLLVKQQKWLSEFCVKIHRVASKNWGRSGDRKHTYFFFGPTMCLLFVEATTCLLFVEATCLLFVETITCLLFVEATTCLLFVETTTCLLFVETTTCLLFVEATMWLLFFEIYERGL
jgi:hypothetical protein